MEAEILFLEINMFVSDGISITPVKISKSRRMRLKKKNMFRQLKKKAGSEGSSFSSDRLSVPPSDLQNYVAPPLPEGIAIFDSNRDILFSIEWGATLSIGKVPATDTSGTEKKRKFPATSSSNLCRGGNCL